MARVMAGDRQDQTVGERGFGVQISGNGNSIVVFARAAELVLARKHARKSAPTTELELPRVDLRAAKLVGRDGDVESLRAWLVEQGESPATVARSMKVGRVEGRRA